MCNFLLYLFQVALLFFIRINGNPIIIRSAIQKNHGQQENLQRYGTVRNKGTFLITISTLFPILLIE